MIREGTESGMATESSRSGSICEVGVMISLSDEQPDVEVHVAMPATTKSAMPESIDDIRLSVFI